MQKGGKVSQHEYIIKEVDPALAENTEPLGTKSKYWFREKDILMLFKIEDRGTGEDWAEKVSCELAALLGLPHVHYDLATEKETNRRGVVCPSCAIKPVELVLGNELLFAIDNDYPADEKNRYKVKAHTVDAVVQALSIVERPPDEWSRGIPVGIDSAQDIFVGYAMLDAWIANQDRHHENWAVLWNGEKIQLAPTFDHGAALARQLKDTEREDRLGSKDHRRRIPYFAARARSAFFEDVKATKSMTTYEAWKAFAKHSPSAAQIWKDQLNAVDDATVESILSRVPRSRMTEVCHTFTASLLKENRHRILADEDL